MEIGIVGLGLIGGSLAKAISLNTDNTVYGYDISEQTMKKAILVNAIEQPLTDELLHQCDIVIVAPLSAGHDKLRQGKSRYI